MVISNDRSELIGATIGDGNIYDHNGRPCWVEITGDAHKDRDYFERRLYEIPYPRIILHIRNERLSLQVYNLLQSHGYNPTFSRVASPHGEGQIVYLSGREQILKYMRDIGFPTQSMQSKQP